MVTKLLLSAAAATMIAAGVAATAYGGATPSVNCENQAKGRHGNMTASCEEGAQAARPADVAGMVAPPRDAAARVNCDNQEKSRHGNQALGCETYAGAMIGAPAAASITSDPQAMKGHRNTIDQ
jgi:hypothetical protein